MDLALTKESTTPWELHSKLKDSLHLRQRASPAESGLTLTHSELHR